jgi:DNA-directed RNA polymerase specialized sigma24 family protein
MTDLEFRDAYGRRKDMLYRFAWRMTGSPAAAEAGLLRHPSAQHGGI